MLTAFSVVMLPLTLIASICGHERRRARARARSTAFWIIIGVMVVVLGGHGRAASAAAAGSDPSPTEQAFQRIVAELGEPMLIVTAVAGDGERSGCLIGFATQTSIHPPHFLVCLSRKNHTYGVALARDAPRRARRPRGG